MARYKTIAVPPELYAELIRVQADIVAERAQHVSMAEVIRELIRAWREKYGD